MISQLVLASTHWDFKTCRRAAAAHQFSWRRRRSGELGPPAQISTAGGRRARNCPRDHNMAAGEGEREIAAQPARAQPSLKLPIIPPFDNPESIIAALASRETNVLTAGELVRGQTTRTKLINHVNRSLAAREACARARRKTGTALLA